MVWIAPKTWVDGAALTSSDLNIHLRDNMMEFPVARATAAGEYFVCTGPNTLVPRAWASDGVTTEQTRDSNDYGDLTTIGPQVTVTLGGEEGLARALVLMTCAGRNSENANVSARMSFAISGASEVDPSDNYAVVFMNYDSSGGAPTFPNQYSHYTFISNLNPGVNTFTAKYRSGVEGSTSNFQVRRLMVLPFS